MNKIVVIDRAPCLKCDLENNFLDISQKKYLSDLEFQGICIAEIPDTGEWQKEYILPSHLRKYHIPESDEVPLVKTAKVLNQTFVHMSPSALRQKKNQEAAKAAKEKSLKKVEKTKAKRETKKTPEVTDEKK